MMKPIHVLIAAAAAAVSTVAAADPAARSVAVEAGDLDLQSDKGQRIAALRIRRAARGLCESRAVNSLPRNMRSERRCMKDAQASAATVLKTLTAGVDPTSGRGG